MDASSLTQSFQAGTLAGSGSFRCERCGFAVSLHELDEIPRCPHCASGSFKRSSIFGDQTDTEPLASPDLEDTGWVDEVRHSLVEPGAYLVWRLTIRTHVVSLQEGWTRLGRSVSAHIRFDDPTVSRRHALLHRDEDGVRVLDDRSLNGVFVNGEHVDWRALDDGDQLVVGRFRIHYLDLDAADVSVAASPAARAAAFS